MRRERIVDRGVGSKGRLSQDGPLWHEHYFELKAINTQQIQKKLLVSPSTTQLPSCTKKREINTDSFLSKNLIFIIRQPLFYKYLLSPSCSWSFSSLYPQTPTLLRSPSKCHVASLSLELPRLCGFLACTLLNLIFYH